MALNEIEKCIMGIKKQLNMKLVDMPINTEEQKRLIRYLINLGCDNEPAWNAIEGHSKYLHQRMKQCYTEHKAEYNEKHKAITNDDSSKFMILDDNTKKFIVRFILGKSRNSKYSKYATALQDKNQCPQNVLYVEEMCDIISELFPDIWKLGQAYFVGELHVKVEPGHKTAFKVFNIR